MPRWAAKVDNTHKAVVEALRAYGWRVKDCSRVGGDFPDLVIAKAGRTILVEVKSGRGKLSDGQHQFLMDWPGETWVVWNLNDVVALNQSGQASSNSPRG
jgi:hypothetical protein